MRFSFAGMPVSIGFDYEQEVVELNSKLHERDQRNEK